MWHFSFDISLLLKVRTFDGFVLSSSQLQGLSAK